MMKAPKKAVKPVKTPSAEAVWVEGLLKEANMRLAEVTGIYRRAINNSLEWMNTARPKQLIPFTSDSDDLWIRAGRGWGKSRVLCEWVVNKLIWSGVPRCRVAIVGRTGGDLRQTIIESDEGIINLLPAGAIAKHEKYDNAYRLWNGSYFRGFTSDSPNSLRGPNFHFGAGDETSSWRYLEALTNLELCVRLGRNPQKIHTTTPKRNEITKYLQNTKGIEVIVGETKENDGNLSPRFIERVYSRYAGTFLAAQELRGEILDEVVGAMFRRSVIDKHRLTSDAVLPSEWMRCIVSIDPQAKQSEVEDEFELGAETGIVVAASAMVNGELHYYILDDYTTRGRPSEWAATAHAAHKQRKAHYYLAETNQGGDMVGEVIRNIDRNAVVYEVHQHRGKRQRAELASLMYDKGLVHHVGYFSELEEQMCEWTGFPNAKEKSPDRMDALVQALGELEKDAGTCFFLTQ